MSLDTLERPQVGDPDLGDDDPIVSHIVKKDGLTQAYIEGTPVRAMCGKVFVPTRDPKRHPLCSDCKEAQDGKGWQ